MGFSLRGNVRPSKSRNFHPPFRRVCAKVGESPTSMAELLEGKMRTLPRLFQRFVRPFPMRALPLRTFYCTNFPKPPPRTLLSRCFIAPFPHCFSLPLPTPALPCAFRDPGDPLLPNAPTTPDSSVYIWDVSSGNLVRMLTGDEAQTLLTDGEASFPVPAPSLCRSSDHIFGARIGCPPAPKGRSVARVCSACQKTPAPKGG